MSDLLHSHLFWLAAFALMVYMGWAMPDISREKDYGDQFESEGGE